MASDSRLEVAVVIEHEGPSKGTVDEFVALPTRPPRFDQGSQTTGPARSAADPPSPALTASPPTATDGRTTLQPLTPTPTTTPETDLAAELRQELVSATGI